MKAKMRDIRPTYTDGVMTVYKNRTENRTSFNAVNNADSMDDLEKIVTLRFNIESKRESDIEFAESHTRTLSLKVSTPLYRAVKSQQLALVGAMLYTLYNVDFDEPEKKMYLYLEEVREMSDE